VAPKVPRVLFLYCYVLEKQATTHLDCPVYSFYVHVFFWIIWSGLTCELSRSTAKHILLVIRNSKSTLIIIITEGPPTSPPLGDHLTAFL